MGKHEKLKKKRLSNTSEGVRGSGNRERTMITDSRFSSLHSDPRFRKVPMHKSKVEIDSRFNRMFTDEPFTTSSAPFDKRGRRKDASSENPLLHYYNLAKPRVEEKISNNNEDVEGEKDVDRSSLDLSHRHSDPESGPDSESVSEEEDTMFAVDPGCDVHEEFRVDIEKSPPLQQLEQEDEGRTSEDDTNSDSDTDMDAHEEYATDIEEGPLQQEDMVQEIEKETHRLAVVNMDWDHVKAVNLYVLLCSCLPKGGQIRSVAIYPSEFGLKRMEEEAVRGPVSLFDDGDAEDSDDNIDELDNEKLRAYERNRLRYYYAVVECDSCATADYLYKACDGVEYEHSGNVLDLRFIPDLMEFKHPPCDVATEAPLAYESLEFNTALQLSKTHLSWDVDEPHRAKMLKRKFNAEQLAELELKEYLASDDSENNQDDDGDKNSMEDQPGKKKSDLYRALLQTSDGLDEAADDDEKPDMEVTFNTGLEDLSRRLLERKKDKEEETVWEEYLRKKREKKKAKKSRPKDSSPEEEETEQPDDFFIGEPAMKTHKVADKEAEASRAELELLLADVGSNGVKGYNLKPKKKGKGKKKGREDEALDEGKIPEVKYDDLRFSKLFSSHLYALDPTDPQFKRSAAYARQLVEKKKVGDRKNGELPVNDPSTLLPRNDDEFKLDAASRGKYELSSLVRSVKMKAKQVGVPGNKVLRKGNEIV